MSMRKVYLKPGTTTRKLLKEIRQELRPLVHDLVWNNSHYNLPTDTVVNEERRRENSEVRYIFGVGHMLRDTMLVGYDVGEDFIRVVFPSNYRGFEQSDFWTKMRVACYDAIMKIDSIDPERRNETKFI